MLDKKFCAGEPDCDRDGKTDSGTDACQGDAGGPLICSVNQQPTLVGVVSKGVSCGKSGKPGIYENVFKYIDWINEKINPVNVTNIGTV